MINSYPKIYNLGHPWIAELFEDKVLIEEKVDGSQFSMMRTEDGELICRSKGAQIHIDAPPKMFEAGVETAKALDLKPGWIYRGEYLQKPKHNTLAYDRVPEHHVILFEVCVGTETYLDREGKLNEAQRIGLEIVPAFFYGRVENLADLEHLMERDSILGSQKIEGIVIKNYERFGRDGKVLLGKYVSPAYREKHKKDWKVANPGGMDIKLTIGSSLRTEARWEKSVQHLRDADNLTDSPKDIGNLLKETNKDILEECEPEIKEALFKWAKKDILRIATQGLPEWYKERLAKSQFSE